MQNTKSNLVRLDEKYIIDLNRVTYVKINKWTSLISKEEQTGYRIVIFLDLSSGNNNQIEISSSKEEINRILDLITQK